MSSKLITRPGFTGKIPSRGDFMTQGLPGAFVDSWHEWMQAILAVSREQLDSRWLDTYLTSPIWHFALSAGACGNSAMLGTMMPSVDQVGRHYPFTLAKTYNGLPVSGWLQSNWADLQEDLILKTLDDDIAIDQWVDALDNANYDWPAEQKVRLTQSHKPPCHLAMVMLHEQPYSLDVLLHQSYQQQAGRYCLWWTRGSDLVPACALLSSGLPAVSQYVAMLNGDWHARGWQTVNINTTDVKP